MKSYCWSACTLPARSGGSWSSSWRRCSREVLDDLLAALVARRARLVDAPLDARALLVDDLVELLGDVVVDAAEVVAARASRAGARAASRASRAGP